MIGQKVKSKKCKGCSTVMVKAPNKSYSEFARRLFHNKDCYMAYNRKHKLSIWGKGY